MSDNEHKCNIWFDGDPLSGVDVPSLNATYEQTVATFHSFSSDMEQCFYETLVALIKQTSTAEEAARAIMALFEIRSD